MTLVCGKIGAIAASCQIDSILFDFVAGSHPNHRRSLGAGGVTCVYRARCGIGNQSPTEFTFVSSGTRSNLLFRVSGDNFNCTPRSFLDARLAKTSDIARSIMSDRGTSDHSMMPFVVAVKPGRKHLKAAMQHTHHIGQGTRTDKMLWKLVPAPHRDRSGAWRKAFVGI